MKKPLLLIADSSEDFRIELKKELMPLYRVLCCEDGQTALEILQTEPVKVLVIDPLLTQIDGITVLQTIAGENIRPIVLMTSTYFSTYILETAAGLGVGYLLQKPCRISTVAARLQDVVQKADMQRPEQRTQIQKLLLEMGFSAKRKGFLYMTETILFVRLYGLQPLTKVVYPAVGKTFGHSWENVERALRTAVMDAWKERNPEIWTRVMQSELQYCPPNGEFIKRVVLYLQQESY